MLQNGETTKTVLSGGMYTHNNLVSASVSIAVLNTNKLACQKITKQHNKEEFSGKIEGWQSKSM